uniref:Uncharacterized protein n=1 Tax=Rhizophora mucronata TaxID=61149 RepID=A0A2P2N8M9_RHIMU
MGKIILLGRIDHKKFCNSILCFIPFHGRN